MNILPYLLEFTGTFLLTGAILLGNWIIILASFAFIILAFQQISGGYANPAVSIAFYLKGWLNTTEVSFYIVSQILGSVAAFYAVKALAVL